MIHHLAPSDTTVNALMLFVLDAFGALNCTTPFDTGVSAIEETLH